MPSSKQLSLACWVLRMALAVQSFGLAVMLLLGTYETEADLYGWLYFDLAWPEATALAIEDGGTWAYLACGGLILALPLIGLAGGRIKRAGIWLQVACLAWMTLWQVTLSGLHGWRGGGFMSDWTLGAHAIRIFTPLGLALLILSTQQSSHRKLLTSEWILRLATGMTFAVHGLEALRLNPAFVDLLISSADHLTGRSLAEESTTTILYVIGMVDIVVALLLVTIRSKALALYMGCWGFVTAFSRMTAAGLGGIALAYPETFIRFAHGAAPLALLTLWFSSGVRRDEEAPATDPTREI